MRHSTRLLLAIGKIKGVGVKTLAQISESDISHITDAGDLLSYVHSERFPLKRKNIKELYDDYYVKRRRPNIQGDRRRNF